MLEVYMVPRINSLSIFNLETATNILLVLPCVSIILSYNSP